MNKVIRGTLRIPTKQTYAYIELNVEGTEEEIINTYLSVTDKYLEAERVRAKRDALPF